MAEHGLTSAEVRFETQDVAAPGCSLREGGPQLRVVRRLTAGPLESVPTRILICESPQYSPTPAHNRQAGVPPGSRHLYLAMTR